MLNKEDLFIGFTLYNGDNVYLGGKLQGDLFYPMLVQYDLEKKEFIVVVKGKKESPCRQYLITDMPSLHGLRVVSNTLMYAQAKVGDKVKITVINLKDQVFKLGDVVEIVAVNEWDVVASALTDAKITATLKVSDFLPLWRWEEKA